MNNRTEIRMVSFDGDIVTYRVVVDDEVWSLRMCVLSGNDVKMSDLCKQIVEDGIANKLDEKKYISVLNSFEY